MEKTKDQKELIEKIVSTLPWGGYALVQEELQKNKIVFSLIYIKKVLSTKTKWWNVDIINAAMEVCNNQLEKIKASKQTANDLIEKLNKVDKS